MSRIAAAGRGRAALALGMMLTGVLAGPGLGAEEWHEAYRAGLGALRRGDGARAVAAFRRAIAERPEPGRNLVTYGTNVEPRYFPYLRLAEAHLSLGQHAEAREALDTSARWNREPAEERRALLARLAPAVEPRTSPPEASPSTTLAPPATTTPAAPPAAPPPPTDVAIAAPAPTAPAQPTPAPPTVAARAPAAAAPPFPPATRPPATRTAASPPPPAQTPPPPGDGRAEEATASATLEIVSQPPGASVYVDDEPLGSTDPETGRLVKGDLPAGRHRVRVAKAGHDEAVSELEINRGARATFHATLAPLDDSPAPWRPELVAFAVVVVALIGLVGYLVLHRPEREGASPWAPTPQPHATGPGPLPTPAAPVSPGGRRDEHGHEWFGDYLLLGLLGRGGMASVFRAERRGELSALKRPLPGFLDDPEFVARFLREADIGRSLNHPNIVRILDRGDVEGVPYFTMELLEGGTLQALLRERGPARPADAARIVAQVGEALDFAHSKGVVHRDLKPSNIMLLPDGTAKVMDFGIARARRFESLTATGAFLGTPEYLSPEAAEGKGTEARSDLYSLGVVFFELLTGRRVFEADTPFGVLKKHCHEAPPAPSQVRPGVPEALDTLVLRLLAKTPEGRPGSAEELVVALREWLHRAA